MLSGFGWVLLLVLRGSSILGFRFTSQKFRGQETSTFGLCHLEPLAFPMRAGRGMTKLQDNRRVGVGKKRCLFVEAAQELSNSLR